MAVFLVFSPGRASDVSVCVFNTESCTLFAVDADTGKQLWSHWLGDPLTSTPTIAGGVVFTSYPANGGGGQLNEVPNNPNLNVPKEKLPLPKPNPEPKPSFDKIDPVKEPKKEPPAKDPVKEKEQKDKAGAAKKAPPCSHVLVALELKTGKILWQRWIESDVMSAPVATDKELFFSTFGGWSTS